MIYQGTDGLSRGDLTEGVMKGETMLSHIPIALSAFERWEGLRPWVESWVGEFGWKPEVLTPIGWYERGHDIDGSRLNSDGRWLPSYRSGTFIWCPPPAVAKQVIEELRQARHKRQASLHIFVCPRWMSHEWRRHVLKSADLILMFSCLSKLLANGDA